MKRKRIVFLVVAGILIFLFCAYVLTIHGTEKQVTVNSCYLVYKVESKKTVLAIPLNASDSFPSNVRLRCYDKPLKVNDEVHINMVWVHVFKNNIFSASEVGDVDADNWKLGCKK